LRSLPALLSSAQDHEGQPLVRTASESIISDMDTTSTILEQREEGPNSERHNNYGGGQPWNLSGRLCDSHILSYLNKTGEVAEHAHLLKDWSVHKTIILAITFIALYQLCTILIHALQVDEVII
jgi:hypothetical protein